MANTQTIDASQLPLERLDQLAKNLNEECNFILGSIQKLKMLQQQFVKSKECLKKFEPKNTNKSVLVPLTSTLYIPGKLSNTETVLVDIGTGYFVDMTIKQAEAYFKRRVEYIGQQVEKITPVYEEKSQAKQAIGEIIQMKVQAAMSAQKKGDQPGTGPQQKLDKVPEGNAADEVD